MENEFDRATKVTLVAGEPKKDKEFEFKTHISSGYNVGGAPNGGYIASICVAALEACLPHPHPLVTTAYFENRCFTEEDAQVFVSVIKSSKRQTFAQARIVQKGEERVRVTAIFTVFDKSNPATTIRRTFPGNPIEKCIKQKMDTNLLPIFARIEYFMEEGTTKVWRGEKDNSAETASYMKFMDGREPDLKALACFADALYPTPFNMQELGTRPGTWIPTLEYTVQYFAPPTPGYVYVHNRCTAIVNGNVSVEGSLWDSQKNLVALSRQTALFTPTLSVFTNKL